MRKIFLYECKRLLANKYFVGLVLVILFYGWQVLNHVTILGVSHTAPFSPWSYGDYLSRMLPLLWVSALFFLTFFTSKAAKRREILTSVTPVNPSLYRLVCCLAALTGTVLLALAVILLALTFYGRMFHCPEGLTSCQYDWRTLSFPTLLTLAPPLIFALGSGWALSRLRHWLIYLWMLLPVCFIALPLPEPFGLLNGSIFTSRPLASSELDPAFSLPAETIFMQILLLLAGTALLVSRLKPSDN